MGAISASTASAQTTLPPTSELIVDAQEFQTAVEQVRESDQSSLSSSANRSAQQSGQQTGSQGIQGAQDTNYVSGQQRGTGGAQGLSNFFNAHKSQFNCYAYAAGDKENPSEVIGSVPGKAGGEPMKRMTVADLRAGLIVRA